MIAASADWHGRYREAIADLPGQLAAAGPIVAGFSATTDAIHTMSDESLTRLLTADGTGNTVFDDGLRTVQAWLAQGRDGELFIDDEAGEALLEAIVGRPERVQCGGTSIQACWSWATMGLQPLLALSNRTAKQLRATAPGVRVMVGGVPVPIPAVVPDPGADVPSNHVLEFVRGLSGAGVTLARSSRITVVFRRKQLHLERGFLEASGRMVRGGVGLVSGLNGLGSAREQSLPVVAQTVARWRDGGARLIHLELAEYAGAGELTRVMQIVGPHVDSVGMNASELARLVGRSPVTAAAGFAHEHGLRRVVVHADDWALCVHQGDRARERTALLAGSLAAANRAEAGAPAAVWALPGRARFATDLPRSGPTAHGYHATVVATPYLATPRSTIGLGDTFVSADLLVHAGAPT